ncbi:MAG: hypothetical protein RMJ66_02530 [Bacteroidia bacterium]|nr:hypothetical protein [Bacteroidia bacterium]MDW8133921.1 hypothetical protein [Bacteroidia bacterium]
MQAKEIIEAVWSDYQRERRTRMERKSFEILLRAFPSIIVAQADGFTDTSEVHRLEEIVAFLCRQEGVPYESIDWRTEMRYLAIDCPFWRERFLHALRALLNERPELYKEQAEFLFAIAAASTGDIVQNLLLRLRKTDKLDKEQVELISDKERAEIEKLTEELNFSAAPEALSYLHTLLEKVK